jgi:hypothetical protein
VAASVDEILVAPILVLNLGSETKCWTQDFGIAFRLIRNVVAVVMNNARASWIDVGSGNIRFVNVEVASYISLVDLDLNMPLTGYVTAYRIRISLLA